MINVWYCTYHDDNYLAVWNGFNPIQSWDNSGLGRLETEYLQKSTIVENFSPYHDYLLANYMNEFGIAWRNIEINNSYTLKQLLKGVA